jgi:hypothetical protein
VTAQSRKFGSHGEDEMRLALEVRYLERCLERGGNVAFCDRRRKNSKDGMGNL